ncbi:branched-chain amino acid ABC transporter permease [Candidatus Thorarchaeota archaeon]|nr:MAG: branched-chain amino acid ABC transporter permease [Candidatus Thorarchaeota archaeon]
MSNEDGSVRESVGHAVLGGIKSIPSVLSSNRTLVAVLAFLFLLPLGTAAGTSPVRALIFLFTQIMIFGLLAMSFDLQLGRASILNFGHVALFGVGAYFMAFSLDADLLPPPFNLVAAIPFPFTIVFAMLIGALLGFIMGLTTSRMKGTAFAFIALAIAMFIYNFFFESPDISGGETGLRVPTPGLIRTAPFYLLFVGVAFVFLAAFMGMVILYLKKRTDISGLILVTPAFAAFTGVLLFFGTNLVGPILVLFAFLGAILLFLMERGRVITNPIEYAEKQEQTEERRPTDMMVSYGLPVVIIVIFLVGIVITFGANVVQMVSLWIEDTTTFYYIIPVQYYLVLSCLVVVYFFIRRLIASPFGRMVTAVAQNEERAQALGYDSYRAKIVVLVISGAIAALAGALYAPYIRTIDPDTALGVGVTIDAMIFTIIGGIGTLFGPLLGTALVKYSELNLVDFITDGLNLDGRLWLVGLGIMYIAIVLFLPLGIVGSIERRSRSIKERLRRLKIGRFEFGLKDTDYWVFALIGIIGLFMLLLFLSL